MGYTTRYRLGIVGTTDVCIQEKENKHIRNSKDPNYMKWLLFMEKAITEHEDPKVPTIEKFRIEGEDFIEIPKAWLNDFIKQDYNKCKWYRREEDMATISKAFPTLMFKLEGEGEEAP